MADRFRLFLPTAELTRAAEAEGDAVYRAVITTDQVDRMGDVVVAEGLDVTAYQRNPVVLFAHDARQPIGRATKLWRDGRKWLAEFTLASTDKAREVAKLIEEKVLGAVSIGFVDTEPPEIRKGEGGEWLGYKFGKTELLEFSIVAVPANAGALIQRAMPDPAAPGHTPPTARPRPSGTRAMPIGSDIARLEKAHQTALDQAEALYTAADSDNRALDEADRKAYDGFLGEAERLSAQLADAKRLEAAMLARAAPVTGQGGPGAPALISRKPEIIKVAKGIPFTRFCISIMRNQGNYMAAAEMAKQWRNSTPEVEALLRAAVAAGGTGDPAWAGALVDANRHMGSEFIELLYPATIMGSLTGLRRVPFNIEVPRQTAGATAQWVGEGKAKPVSKLAFDKVKLDHHKLAVIAVLTAELVRFSDPSAEALVQADLIRAIAKAIDTKFISADAAVAGVSPAGILNGVSATTSTGSTVAAIRTDVLSILGKFNQAEIPIGSIASIMNEYTFMVLSSMGTVSDNPAFPEMAQGRFFGTRIVQSNTVTRTAGGGGSAPNSDIIFVSEPSVMLAADPGVRVDMSTQATLEMSDTPETETGTQINLWQNNMVGLLVEQFITWTKARAEAVQVLDNLALGPVVP